MWPQGICSWSVINKRDGPGTLSTGHEGVGPRRAQDRVSPGLPFLCASSSSPSPGPWLPLSALEGAPEEPSSGRQIPRVPREMDKGGAGGHSHVRGQASRKPWNTHCKCLKVMSGKPVALDPEGERQSAST